MFGRDRDDDLAALAQAKDHLSDDDRSPRQSAEVIDFPSRTDAPTPEVEVTEVATTSEDTPVQGEIVDDTDESGQRVDAEIERHLADRGDWLAELAQRAATRQPVIPAWASSRSEAAATLRWVAAFYAHVGAYHATRSPLYLARLGLRTPIGAGRIATRLVRYVLDLEGEPMRYEAAQRNDPETYIKLTRQRDRRVRARLISLALLAVPTAVAAFMVAAAPAWVVGSVLAGVGAVLGWVGRPADRPMINRAVLPSQVEPLTSDVVLRALGATNISEINKALSAKSEAIKFVAPITRDGPGWRAELDLPFGVTAADIIERRDKLSSGLRRPMGCVWPEPVSEEHEGRLVLWVGDQDMNKAKQPAWPLLKSGQADLFKPVPFGADQRGRAVSMLLMFESVLIGAKPRMGKTFALRVLLLACALDVLTELLVFELKGTGDCSALGQVAHDYGSGADDDTLARGLKSLYRLDKEMETRAKTISGLPKDLCPENKVTPELAAKKNLGLHPIVLAIDECQELFTHPEFGKEAARLCERIIKRGPALGIILILATQRPDASSLPTGVAANVGIRFCLRVMGQVENDMVLGTSSYKNGLRATTFTAKDKGIGYLVGVDDDPIIARSAYIDGPAADRVAERARVLRQRAGTLSGYAIGQHTAEDTAPASTVLDDLLAAWPAGEEKAWSAALVDRLAELRPESYGAWAEQDDTAKARQLSTALKPFGIETAPVGRRIDGKSVTRYGLTRTAITEKVTERDNRKASERR